MATPAPLQPFDIRRSRRAVLLLVLIPLTLAALTFIGYAMNMPMLVSIRPEFRAMSSVTATCVLLLSAGLVISSRGQPRIGGSFGIAAALLALSVLASYAAHSTDQVSAWWARSVLQLPATTMGMTSRSTALSICLISVALVLRSRSRLADLSAAGSLVLATVALLGYAYGVDDLYAVSLFNNMALHTALALFFLSIATVCLRPDLGWAAVVASSYAAGGAARRQLAFACLPPVVGWCLVQTLYAGWFGIGAVMAVFVAATILPLVLLVLRDGRQQIALDNERRARDNELAEIAEQAQRQLERQSKLLRAESAERAKVEEVIYRAQRMEAVGQLTGGIAHDFNNLLMAISGNVQLLKRKLGPDDPAQRFVASLTGAVSKGAKVTQQLLAFSRSQRLDIQPHSIEPVIVSARELIGNSLGPQVGVTIRLDAPNAWAMCDADQLELSLLNLAVNARDAMPDGGQLTIESSVAVMEQAPQAGSPCVLIRVADTGTGMSPEVAARAAEPFYTTKERGKGTGLGLAQVYGFVLQCHGEFRLLSTPGRGTTVELRFPAAEPVAAATEEAPAAPSRHEGEHKRRRVIVIDDDDGVREVIVQALTEAGYDVTSAADGASGLLHMQAFEPAAAVIDFIMPGMNGADVARAAQARHPQLPIIFVSGYSDTLALEGVSGASVLRKPFEMQTLTQMVDLAIADH